MIGLDELVRRFAGLDRVELRRWIENRWIVPEQPGEETPVAIPRGRYRAGRADPAFRREFAIDDEAMPLVLGLLDQVYSLRRQMRRLCDAIEGQPTDIRDAIRLALAGRGRRAGRGQRTLAGCGKIRSCVLRDGAPRLLRG